MKGCNAHLSVLFLMHCWNLRKLFRMMDARKQAIEGGRGEEEAKNSDEDEVDREEDEEGEEAERDEEDEEDEVDEEDEEDED
jgi:hypothetical protein